MTGVGVQMRAVIRIQVICVVEENAKGENKRRNRTG